MRTKHLIKLEGIRNKNTFRKSGLKYAFGFLFTFGVLLLPRPPNIEPVLTTTMPFGKRWGWFAGFLFGFSSIILYNLLKPTPGFAAFGIWTWVTAAMYGLIGIGAGIYLKNKLNKVKYYVGFGVLATLIYDFITGPIMSSYAFHMTFMQALIGQIPFTLLHLLGNVVGAIFVSPLIYRWVVSNKQLDIDVVYTKVKSLLVKEA